MRPKSGLPKRRALRNMPKYTCGLKDNPNNNRNAHPNMKNKTLENASSVMSMFCGCGGLDLGFLGGFKYLDTIYKPLPFNILKAIDNDSKSIETYRLNISDHAEVGDLTEIDPKTLPKARVLIGGFPCQDFSSAGPKLGFAGARGLLYLAMIAYMKIHKPDIVIGENVPYIATLHDGIYLKKIISDLETVGYNVAIWNLFAPDYGLSQSRRRIFIVANRKDLGYPPEPPKSSFSGNYLPIEHAIDDLKSISDETVTNQSQYFMATKASSGGGQGDHSNIRGELSYCIRANAKARIQFHYDLERRLTVRECARLQSFPDEFVFPFAAMTNMTQIGNAVPPILGYTVAKTIAKHLKSIDEGKIITKKPILEHFISSSRRTRNTIRSENDETQLGLFTNE